MKIIFFATAFVLAVLSGSTSSEGLKVSDGSIAMGALASHHFTVLADKETP